MIADTIKLLKQEADYLPKGTRNMILEVESTIHQMTRDYEKLMIENQRLQERLKRMAVVKESLTTQPHDIDAE